MLTLTSQPIEVIVDGDPSAGALVHRRGAASWSRGNMVALPACKKFKEPIDPDPLPENATEQDKMRAVAALQQERAAIFLDGGSQAEPTYRQMSAGWAFARGGQRCTDEACFGGVSW